MPLFQTVLLGSLCPFRGITFWSEIDELDEAKRLANDYADDPFAEPDSARKKEYWEKQCLPLIREARTLLAEDENFLAAAVDLVYRLAYKECLDIITSKVATKAAVAAPAWAPDAAGDRKFLGISPNENLDAELGENAEHVYKARAAFEDVGVPR